MNRNRRRFNAGFSLIEILAVLAITAVLAAIAAPSLIGFLESGRQANRMSIARTIYLGAQNRLTELRLTKNLKLFLVSEGYYSPPAPYTENISELEDHNNVWKSLDEDSSLFPAADAGGEENYIHYISKPRGSTDPDNPVVKLLDPVILDKNILNDAILIEFNIRTGVVLSVFYSDSLTTPHSEFGYSGSASDDEESWNVYGARAYVDFDRRMQGYYGVGDTTRSLEINSPAIVNVYDSYSRPLPDSPDNKNMLYAEMIIPEKELEGAGNFGLSIITADGSSHTVKTVAASDFLAPSGGEIYRYDGLINDEVPDEQKKARIIWVLDYAGGDMRTPAYSISRYASVASFDGTSNIRVGLQGSVSAESVTAVNPYFNTGHDSSYAGDSFTVMSARHLHNVRHFSDGNFTQRADIDLAATGSEVGNFAPILDFAGVYTGSGFSIRNLSINTSSSDTGLFGSVADSAYVVGVTLENPNVTGGDNTGALCGRLNGVITGALVRYNDAARLITGGENTGGIVGFNETGILIDSTFVSPTNVVHMSGGETTTGGIVGLNGTGGRLQRLMFLAISPTDSTVNKLTPVVGLNNAPESSVGKLCYLSGTAIWPDLPSPAAYNTAGIKYAVGHVAQSTMEICVDSMLTSGGQWTIVPLSDEERLDHLGNNRYPYPYARYSEAGIPDTAGQWPIAEGGSVLTFSDLAYYERYDDGSYGVWTYNGGYDTLRNDLEIKEAGYFIMMDENLTGIHHFFARNADASGDWSAADAIEQLILSNTNDLANGVAASLGKNSGEVWAFKLPLDKLSAKENQSKPLHLMYTINDATGGSPKTIGGYIQPLFAKGLYINDNPSEFYIRTPWQMKNISVLTGSADYTLGKTFMQEMDLNFQHTGIGVNSAVDSTDVIIGPVVDGTFNGTFDGLYNGERKVIGNVTGALSSINIGLFSSNGGIIKNVTLEDSQFTGLSRVGGIAGTNGVSAVIENCLVTETGVTATGSNVGGIAGENAGSIVYSGVTANSVKITGTGGNVGGITGANHGTVSNVFFLSANDADDLPVSNSGGGIVGSNGGKVTSALYLAPAPTVTTGEGSGNEEVTIYPIVRSGNRAEQDGGKETCFYLFGSRFSLNGGIHWTEAPYNSGDANSKTILSGGGSGLISSFIDKEWLNYVYDLVLFEDARWYQPSSSYPYPMIEGMGAPDRYPLADNPTRPDQVNSSSWETTLSTADRANNISFINADFDGQLVNPANPDVTYNILDPGNNNGGFNIYNPPAIFPDRNGSNYYYMYSYYGADWVQGWNTRPVDPNNKSNPYWNTIEFQRPESGASYGRVRTNYNGTMDGVYAELNAEVPGTLYQICSTKPGTEMYYSFYHAKRSDGGVQRMNFYLSGMVSNGNQWEYSNGTGRPTIIRPCITPRGNGLSSNATRNTVVYGTTSDDVNINVGRVEFYDPKSKTTRSAYLYDVWVTDYGYGITFWSDTNVSIGSGVNQIPSGGVADTVTAKTSNGQSCLPSSLVAAARDNIIGYWDVEQFASNRYSEWKQYYGLYTIPEGQVTTEFAYESASTRNLQEGNYLDGISFKSPGFLSVQKYARFSGKSIMYVQPDDTVEIELAVKNWGEVSAGNIVLTDTLKPFDEYVSYVNNSLKVTRKGGSGIDGAIAKYDSSAGVLTVTLPENVVLATNEELSVTFKIHVRRNVQSNPGVLTLLYYFRNQAIVEYRDAEFFGYARGGPKKNASEPIQVFIDPISLSKTVESGSFIGGPFTIELEIEKKLDDSSVIQTQGLINDLIPSGFEITDMGNLPSNSITKSYDGSTRITIKNVNLRGTDKSINYHYTIDYVGDGYGVMYTNTTADYKYLYSIESGEILSVMNIFPQPVVGIKVKADEREFTAAAAGVSTFSLIDMKSFTEKLSNANGTYDTTPELILVEEDRSTAARPNANGDYQINHAAYTATLLKSTNELLFEPKAGASGSYVFYYKVKLVANKPGGTPETLDLSSDYAKITVTIG